MRMVELYENEFRNRTLDAKARAGMQEMRLAGQLCDVVLIGGTVEIPAHKVVLASTSEYFHLMFTNNFEEAKNTIIPIMDLKPEILDLLVEYCYTGKILITEDNLENLFAASMMLQFCEITDACYKILKNKLKPDNCLGFKAFAEAYGHTDLVSYCNSYISKKFLEVVKQEEFLELNLEQLLDLISSDKIALENEDPVFESIMLWINNDRDSRSRHFPDIMKHVRFTFCSSDYFIRKGQNDSLITEFINKQEFVCRLRKMLLKEESAQSLKSLCNKPRQYHPNAIVVIGGRSNSNKCPNSVKCYFFKEKQWSIIGDIPDSRVSSGAAVVGDKVFVVGGWKNEDILSSVFMYDSSFDTWTSSVPCLQSGRSGHGVAVLTNRIYAVGGINMEGNELDTAEVLDVAMGGRTQAWRNIANMNTRRRGVAIGVLNGKLLAVGGHDGKRCLSSVESYDPETDTWSPVADMTVPRYGAGVAVLNGFLYCVGGRSSRVEKIVEKYNPDTNSWSLVTKMNHSRTYAGVVTYKGCLYVIGGYCGKSLTSIEMYDPRKDTWIIAGKMPVGREGFAVALVHRPCTLMWDGGTLIDVPQ